MSALTRDGVKAAEDLKRERLDVPEWGGYLFVRTMTAGERERWENKQFTAKGKDVQVNLKNITTSLAIEVCVDESGQKLFTADDVEMLNGKSCVVLQRIFDKAREVNRIGKQDVEEMVKNSETTPADDSPSA